MSYIVAKEMKTPLAISAVVAVGIIFVAAWMIGPCHDYFGQKNTNYSSSFTEDRYDEIRKGMSYESVIHLLGEPLSASVNRDYPVWALRDANIRERLGRDTTFDMKVISYSEPLDQMKDYELVQIAFDQNLNVVEPEKWVTD